MMEVRLTDEGRKLLGFGPDRITASVSNPRAFVLMENRCAIEDRGFMALFSRSNPAPAPAALPDPDPVEGPPANDKKPKEKAVSRAASKREKAIKED